MTWSALRRSTLTRWRTSSQIATVPKRAVEGEGARSAGALGLETTQKATTEVSRYRQKARDLIELAHDESTTEEERVSAAMKAVGLIYKHDLLASPLDDLLGSRNETVRAASTVIDKITDPDFIDSVKTISGQVASVRRRSAGDRRRKRRR